MAATASRRNALEPRQRIAHTGRHKGFGGEVYDPRETTRAYNGGNAVYNPGTRGGSASWPGSGRSWDGTAKMPTVFPGAPRGTTPSPAQQDRAMAGQQSAAMTSPTAPVIQPVKPAALAPVMPKGMVATKIDAPGPYAPGMAPKVPGMRPAKGLIDGMPAKDAIAGAKQSAALAISSATPTPDSLTSKALQAAQMGQSANSKALATQAGTMQVNQDIAAGGFDSALAAHRKRYALEPVRRS